MSGSDGEFWELAVMECEAENILVCMINDEGGGGGHALTKDEGIKDGAGWLNRQRR